MQIVNLVSKLRILSDSNLHLNMYYVLSRLHSINLCANAVTRKVFMSVILLIHSVSVVLSIVFAVKASIIMITQSSHQTILWHKQSRAFYPQITGRDNLSRVWHNFFGTSAQMFFFKQVFNNYVTHYKCISIPGNCSFCYS